jgi:DNA (cytosine-5)-methyltransferase 1
MSHAYYNENDPFAAAWLRELIKAKVIADGIVDERSIKEVQPSDVQGYTQCHWFAGIGVWSYALRAAGWSDDTPVWTGSCPCQSFSASGKRGGFSDKRHLWPAWFRLICESHPHYIFGEQTSGKDGNAWLDVVSSDLEGIGYAFGAADIPACGFGAPHKRNRLYFVANSSDTECRRRFKSEHSKQRRDVYVTDSSKTSWLANTNESSEHGWTSSGEQSLHRFLQQDADGRMADTETPKWRGPRVKGNGGGRTAEVRGPGSLGELANSNGERLEKRKRSAELEGQGLSTKRPSYVNGFWSDAEWLWCRDEKYRAVEPGTFPLATRSPNRMGRLRGYGNALCAPAAQAFIESYMDIAWR